ncbi:MAG: hypothetical protein JXJ22_08775 [Bacteroidales bacterium]|nr:hypothetical protein [Bacteroidales bacterium]
MVIYQDDYVKLEFDESVPCVIWTPLQFLYGEKFRSSMLHGIDFIENKIKELPDISWLNDASRLKAVKKDDVIWLNQNANNRAYEMGVKKMAFVLPDNIFGKIAVKLYVEITTKHADNKLLIKAFGTLDKAKSWLKAESDVLVEEESL